MASGAENFSKSKRMTTPPTVGIKNSNQSQKFTGGFAKNKNLNPKLFLRQHFTHSHLTDVKFLASTQVALLCFFYLSKALKNETRK